jgi:hypothetical protein
MAATAAVTVEHGASVSAGGIDIAATGPLIACRHSVTGETASTDRRLPIEVDGLPGATA